MSDTGIRERRDGGKEEGRRREQRKRGGGRKERRNSQKRHGQFDPGGRHKSSDLNISLLIFLYFFGFALRFIINTEN